jgi:hypothetical protein
VKLVAGLVSRKCPLLRQEENGYDALERPVPKGPHVPSKGGRTSKRPHLVKGKMNEDFTAVGLTVNGIVFMDR